MAIAYQGPALQNDIIYPSVSETIENAIGSNPAMDLGNTPVIEMTAGPACMSISCSYDLSPGTLSVMMVVHHN